MPTCSLAGTGWARPSPTPLQSRSLGVADHLPSFFGSITKFIKDLHILYRRNSVPSDGHVV